MRLSSHHIQMSALHLILFACIAFIDNPDYCRLATRWYLASDTNDWPLFLNGVDQHSPEIGGPASINLLNWSVKYPVLVGIADDAHGIALDNIITNVCPGAKLFHASADANGIRACVSNGCQIINISWFTTVDGQPADDLSNACYEASQSGVILVCSVPNINESIDATPVLPASLNLPLLIPVTSSTRQDTLYSPAAVGTNVIAAPGRVILTQAPDGTPAYGTGTSYAAPIVTGTVAWMLGQFQQTPAVIVKAIRSGSVPIDNRIQGRLSMAGAVNALRAIMTFTNGIPEAHGIGEYQMQYSSDFIIWSDLEPTDGNRYYRAFIK